MTVICRTCGEPFTRRAGRPDARSSNFYRTKAENDTCICCREGLDPDTLQPKVQADAGAVAGKQS